MAYVTSADLALRYPWELFYLDDNRDGTADATAVAEVIALAEAELNDAAAQHYTVPLDVTDTEAAAILKYYSGSLAAYHLSLRRETVSDAVRAGYEKAQEWLQRLREGKVVIPGNTPATRTPPTGGIVVVGETAQITRTNMRAI